MRPSLVVTAINDLSLNWKTTGDEVSSCPARYTSFTCNVFASRATRSPPVVETYTVPSPPNAGPADPATSPLCGFQLVTALDAISSAHRPLGTPPQTPTVAT